MAGYRDIPFNELGHSNRKGKHYDTGAAGWTLIF